MVGEGDDEGEEGGEEEEGWEVHGGWNGNAKVAIGKRSKTRGIQPGTEGLGSFSDFKIDSSLARRIIAGGDSAS